MEYAIGQISRSTSLSTDSAYKVTIPEQRSVLKSFSCPFTFLDAFIKMSLKQQFCSTKIFLENISYFEKYKMELLQKVVDGIDKGDEMINKVEVALELLRKCESFQNKENDSSKVELKTNKMVIYLDASHNLMDIGNQVVLEASSGTASNAGEGGLADMISYPVPLQSKEHADPIVSPDLIVFLNISISIIYKGINILLDKVESQIIRNNYRSINILYKYTTFNIDLYSHFTQRILCRAGESVNFVEDIISQINLIDADIALINEMLVGKNPFGTVDVANEINPKNQIVVLEKVQLIQGFALGIKSKEEKTAAMEGSGICNSEYDKVESTGSQVMPQSLAPEIEIMPLRCFDHIYTKYSELDILKNRHLIKVELSEGILGDYRILKYNIEIVIKNIAQELTTRKYSSAEEAYITIMNFTGEISKSKYKGIEPILETLKEYARFLLVDK